MKKGKSDTPEWISGKAILRFIASLLFMPMALFIAAGTVHWTMGWGYVGVSYAFTVISSVLVFRQGSGLLAERAQSLDSENVKGWDKAILLFALVLGPLVTYVLAGLDKRFSWSPQLSLPVQLLAVALVVGGHTLSTWAMMVNRFFSAVVRIQRERNQIVVKEGPYRAVRHPGYAGLILVLAGTPFMLGSLWAILPVTLIIVLTVVRTSLEDNVLRDALDGYQAYCQEVRYRLCPGIW